MDIGSCKSANSRINIVKRNNFRIIVKIIEMGIFSYLNVNYRKGVRWQWSIKCNSCSTSFSSRKGKFGDFLGFWVLCVCQFQSVIDDFGDEIYLSFSCERDCLL